MKSSRTNYLVVGAFVLGMLALGIVLVARLAGSVGAADNYTTSFDSVIGLVPGTQVLFEGFPIGQVAGMEPTAPGSPKRFRLELSVRRGWAIPEDSEAVIIQPSLLAPMTIDINAGRSPKTLEPGAEIAGRDTASLIGAVSSITGDVDEILRDAVRPLLEKVLGSTPTILENLEGFSESLNAAGGDLRDVVNADNKKRISSILGNFDKASGNLSNLSGEIGQTRADLDRLLQNMNAILDGRDKDVDRMVADLRHTLQSIASHIDAVNANIEGASQNLYEFSREVRANPTSLLTGSAPDDESTAPAAAMAP